MSSSEKQGGLPPAPGATPAAAASPPAPASESAPAVTTESAATGDAASGASSVGETAAAPSAAPPPAPIPEPVEINPIPAEYFRPSEIDGPLRVLLVLFVIGFGVFVANHWSKYDKYSGQTEQGWHKGSKQMVEITLVRDDKNKLDCASNIAIEGLGCAFDANSQARPQQPKDKTLHPYCNIKNDVLLAAGLWDSPGLPKELPAERFTVVCNYNVVGVVKTVSLRWNTNDKFDPAKQSLPIGTLTDCVIPQ
jgi:hypothetical protein